MYPSSSNYSTGIKQGSTGLALLAAEYGGRIFTGVDYMANTYADDANYLPVGSATDGDVTVYLSKDGGSTWTAGLTETMPTSAGSEAVVTWGDGSTELWGTTWVGDDVDDTSFRIMFEINGNTLEYGIVKTLGFAPGAAVVLTGVEVAIKGYYASNITYINHIKAKIYYGTSVMPVQAGSQAFASNGRKAGEGAGAGTGVLTFFDGSNWIACDTGANVAA
jgi:hypothetical protein